MKCPHCKQTLEVSIEALSISDREDICVAALKCDNCETYISTHNSTVNIYMDTLKDKILELSRKFEDPNMC